MLCPELRLDKIERLARGSLLLNLIQVRVEEPDQCNEHDGRFVLANLPESHHHLAETLAAERGSLFRTFLHDVITIVENVRSRDISLPVPSGLFASPERGGLVVPAAPHAEPPLLELCPWTPDPELHLPAEDDEGDPAHPAALSEARCEAVGDPVRLLAGWIAVARAKDMVMSAGQAATLATCDPQGWPSARVVLLKSMDRRGFVFFTHGLSHKGLDMKANPRAALNIYWDKLFSGRQVRIEGIVERLSQAESEAYFAKRPAGSRRAAAAAVQSSLLPGGREQLEEMLERARDAEGEGGSAMPQEWGGWRIVPVRVEFWASGDDRLHDRVAFVRAEAERVGMMPRGRGREPEEAPPDHWGIIAEWDPAAERSAWRIERRAP